MKLLSIAATMLALLISMPSTEAAVRTTAPSAEGRTAAYFDRISSDPPLLRIFLQAMPKGADLHNHIRGSVYAEDLLRWAESTDLCIDTTDAFLTRPPCETADRVPVKGLALRDYGLYTRAIDAMSTRGFEHGVNNPRISGFDRFFSSFDAFFAFQGANAETIAAPREQAALDNVSYVELLNLPAAVNDLMPTVTASGLDGTDFSALESLLSPIIPAAVAHAKSDFDNYESQIASIERCGSVKASRACGVTMRYQVAVLRNQPPAQVFAQIAFGFALVRSDSRFVGVNIVAPEHQAIPIRDYSLHMKMFAYFKARNPAVQLSLHAGELTLGLVPPRDLRFHIREAVEVAGAKRIGHGVDISYESNAPSLLRRMARDRIAVEVNLTSNAVILGVKGREHPLSLYRAAGVPIVISTDDEGVGRTDMTNEYMRAVGEQHLNYHDLKQIVRDSMQYAFLAGASIWKSHAGGARIRQCSGPITSPAATCAAFLRHNPKARLQWDIERDLSRFEADHAEFKR